MNGPVRFDIDYKTMALEYSQGKFLTSGTKTTKCYLDQRRYSDDFRNNRITKGAVIPKLSWDSSTFVDDDITS